MDLYQHVPHPHIEQRKDHGPVKVDDHHPHRNRFTRMNSRVAVGITVVVGTMWCAYLFTALALVSLPAALQTADKVVIIGWIAQTFLQLVLLPIIIVGQNVQAKATDARAEQTYLDAEAVLHEALQIQAHLAVQDRALLQLADKLAIELKRAGG